MRKLTKELAEQAKELNILYVEDDFDTLELQSMFFKVFFNRVDTAQNGEEGFEKYNDYFKRNGKHYDIVITDLTMPKVDGVELSRMILAKNESQPIVVVSANEELPQLINLINLGINYFVQKPIEPIKLETVLKKAVKNINNEIELVKKTKILNEQKEKLEVEVQHKTLSLYQRLYYDNLTKLPRRNKLIEDLEALDTVGLMIININDFRNINSVYGHDIGDKVLKEFSAFLLNIALERRCSLYNIGGDEFVILNVVNDTEGFCIESSDIILDRLESEGIDVDIHGELTNISLNITIGIAKEDKNMLNHAQMALEYANRKKQPFMLYNEEIDIEKNSTEDIKITKLIKKAIEEDRVVPYFQPIVNKDGSMKYETLMRIEEGDRVISPFFFLDIAKKVRYYDKLTRIMIEKAFNIFSKKESNFSINLSFEDIINSKTIDFLFEMIEKYDVQNKLIIEILESENIDDFTIVRDFIFKVKKLGVKIAIDDFGSGYSNFSYLLDMKPDFVKIDGSIIKNIHDNDKSYMIAKTIVDISKKLGAESVAEYIHCDEVFERAKELDINSFQGFYFSEPKKDI